MKLLLTAPRRPTAITAVLVMFALLVTLTSSAPSTKSFSVVPLRHTATWYHWLITSAVTPCASTPSPVALKVKPVASACSVKPLVTLFW